MVSSHPGIFLNCQLTKPQRTSGIIRFWMIAGIFLLAGFGWLTAMRPNENRSLASAHSQHISGADPARAVTCKPLTAATNAVLQSDSTNDFRGIIVW